MDAAQQPIPAPVRVLGMVQDFWASRAVYAAAELGVFDHLQQPATAQELADRAGWHAGHLGRLLRALAARGWLLRDDEGRYRNSDSGAVLAEGPGSMRSFVRSILGHGHFEPWGECLPQTIAAGGTAFDRHFGMPIWAYYEQHPDTGAVFNQAMTAYSEATAAAVLAAYDFSAFRRVIDIGGGHGRLLTGVLQQAKDAEGIVFDQPSVIAGAELALAASPVAARARAEAGDFFAAVPADGDAYLLKFIIHDWDEERALAILRQVRAAMQPSARVILVETVLPETVGDDFGIFLDLNMLTLTGGQERTQSEYAQLLAAAGLELQRVLPTASTVSIIEATAAS